MILGVTNVHLYGKVCRCTGVDVPFLVAEAHYLFQIVKSNSEFQRDEDTNEDNHDSSLLGYTDLVRGRIAASLDVDLGVCI